MLLERALPSLDWLEFPRAQAYALLGLCHAFAASPLSDFRSAIERISAVSRSLLEENTVPGWVWFEDVMTYDNARLPEALLVSGMALEDGATIDAGLRSLDFLENVVFENGIFVPIGNDEWYRRGGPRARFAQQPLEAVATVDAELAAFEARAEPERLAAAELAHAWYHGRNVLGVQMAVGGGCYDGLDQTGRNANMGAESTLAHLASAYALALRQKQPSGTR
jgi:hypothetical protein